MLFGGTAKPHPLHLASPQEELLLSWAGNVSAIKPHQCLEKPKKWVGSRVQPSPELLLELEGSSRERGEGKAAAGAGHEGQEGKDTSCQVTLFWALH